MHTAVWVKRPNALPTRIGILSSGALCSSVPDNEFLVDDLRECIIAKYPNSIGRYYDTADLMISASILKPGEDGVEERMLYPDENLVSFLDSAFPKRQMSHEALTVYVPLRSGSIQGSFHSTATNGCGTVVDATNSQSPVDTATVSVSVNPPEYFFPSPTQVHSTVSTGQHHPALSPGAHASHASANAKLPEGYSAGICSDFGRPRRRSRPAGSGGSTSAGGSANGSGLLLLPNQRRSSMGNIQSAGLGAKSVIETVNEGPKSPAAAAVVGQQPSKLSTSSGLRLPTSRHWPESGEKDRSVPGPSESAPLEPLPLPDTNGDSGTADGSGSGADVMAKEVYTETETKNDVAASNQIITPSVLLEGVVPLINVLIVEDNIVNQRILEAFMRKRNIPSETAKDGREAVDKWKNGEFHLVLMDIQLPVMSGIEATKEIRRLERINHVGVSWSSSSPTSSSPGSSEETISTNDVLPPLPFRSPVIIVALTASSTEGDRHQALAAGCNDFLTKPVSLVWLERKTVEWGCMQALIRFKTT